MTDRIGELEAKLAMLQQNQNVSAKSVIWGVLDDKTRDLSEKDIAAINSSPEVKSRLEEMMGAFTGMFLFGKYRDEFAAIPAFRPMCDKYIAAVLDAKAARYQHTAELEAENQRLKEELAAARRGER